MEEENKGNDAKKCLILGLCLSWTPVIPVAVGLLGSLHTGTALASVHDVAGSVIIAFLTFGLLVTALSQIAAVVLLLRSLPFGYRVFAALSICWSGLVLALSGVCVWMVLGKVVMR
jgi:hypothetical protein